MILIRENKAAYTATAFLLLILLVPLLAPGQIAPGGIYNGGTLKLWLDKTSINVDGSIPAIGAVVSSWSDKSGNNITLTANVPSVATYGANGVIFNNTGYLASSDAGFPTGNASRTLIICASSPSTNADDGLFFYGVANDNQSYGLLKIGNTAPNPDGVRSYFYSNDFDAANGLIPSNTLKVITTTYTNNTQSIYLNMGTASSRTPAIAPSTVLGGFSSLQVGGWSAFDLFSQATIAEVIFHNALLDAADIIIINNYLAAKYGITLTANDLYTQDNVSNGNYDYDVAGIGRAANATQQNTDAQGSIIRINSPSNLGNNEYYIWGHDGGALTPVTADIPSGAVQARLARIWRGSEIGNVGNVTITFNLTGLGTIIPADLRLLVDTNNNGVFSDETTGVISGATNTSGNLYAFTNVSVLNNNIRFTLATANTSTTPLPIEMHSFDVRVNSDMILLDWETASELNNSYFEVQRMQDNIDEWEVIEKLTGAGNSNERQHYHTFDKSPFPGRSYYRLKQVDFDGQYSFSPVRTADFRYQESFFPNPTSGTITIASKQPIDPRYISVLSTNGVKVNDRVDIQWVSGNRLQLDLSLLPEGIYLIRTPQTSKLVSKR